MSRRLRLMVLTPVMAPSRVPLFNALAGDPAIDLIVVYLATTAPNRRWGTLKREMRFRHDVLHERLHWERSDSFVHVSTGLIAALSRWRPDVVVAGGWDQVVHLEALALRRVFGYAFVWWVESTLRDRRAERRWTRFTKEQLIRAADAIVVPGRAAWDYVETLGASSANTFLAPNAVDNHFYSTANVDRSGRSGTLRFLSVGRLEPAKGILYLLDAWNRVGADAILVLAGHGSLESAIRARIESASMPPVELRGPLDRDELVVEYAQADALVFATLTDTWGLVINEAMAAGLPVVTTTAPGAVDDLVEHEANGLVVESASADELLDAMERLAADRTLRLAMGMRSADRIREFEPHDWAHGVHQASYTAYEQMVARNA